MLDRQGVSAAGPNGGPSGGRVRLLDAMPACEYYPIHLDAGQRTISFARISRTTYRDSAFLVPRMASMGSRQYTFNLDDLLLEDMGQKPAAACAHFILISAFCCSTLLARYMDLVPGCLVLREPGLLGQLAMMRFQPEMGRLPAAKWGREWESWAKLGLRLMSRTFEPGETVVVKAADVCNAMAEALLGHDARSKAVLLSIDLYTFILSVLKSDGRREWIRQRAAFWRRVLAHSGLAAAQLPPCPDDARKAAYIWLLTEIFWEPLAARVGRERVLSLDGEEVANRPEATVARVAEFFGRPLDPKRLSAIVSDPMTAKHAKHPGKPYDSEARAKDVAEWEARFGAEADAAVRWAMDAPGLPGAVRIRVRLGQEARCQIA